MPKVDWHKCMYCEREGINKIEVNLHEITSQESGLYDYVCDWHILKYKMEHDSMTRRFCAVYPLEEK